MKCVTTQHSPHWSYFSADCCILFYYTDIMHRPLHLHCPPLAKPYLWSYKSWRSITRPYALLSYRPRHTSYKSHVSNAVAVRTRLSSMRMRCGCGADAVRTRLSAMRTQCGRSCHSCHVSSAMDNDNIFIVFSQILSESVIFSI
jgi:hypothetical protein